MRMLSIIYFRRNQSRKMQKEEKVQETTLESLFQRVQEIKNTIISFLLKLEQGYETLSWPTVLDNFALLSGQINMLTRLIKSDRIPQLRGYVLLPLVLSPERDAELEKLTEGRVMAFNHEVVPDYLRTKPDPEVDDKMMQFQTRANQTTPEILQKQITTLNKISMNMIEIINSKRAEWEDQRCSQPTTSSLSDTNTVIAAISFGKSLKPSKRQDSGQGQHSSDHKTQHPSSQSGGSVHVNKPTSTVKTNIKSASNVHPYGRH
ncbi:Mediator of RNA polymerase II transcription subunit 8 [Lamellibrachia satsuma]|nr:Mediator of RNA polymerase II transcription subunit 8 [Lamellibrachia satsuma]